MGKHLIWAIFWWFRGQVFPNCKFFRKNVSFKLKVIFSINFRPKTKKIVISVFEKNIKVSDFGQIWRPFREHLLIKEPLLRKLHYQPTNQPIIANITSVIWPRWHGSNNQNTTFPQFSTSGTYFKIYVKRGGLIPWLIEQTISFLT